MGIKDRRFWFAAAGLWGFAEATAFFIVPDVLLSAAAIVFGFAAALRFAAVAAAAAALGGLLMLRWGAGDADSARAFVLAVPLVGEDLLRRVGAEIEGAWAVHLAAGAVSGAPYKIYAVEAGAAGIGPALFALVSLAARFARFALTIGLVALGAAALNRIGAARWAPWALAACWAAIYGGYAFIRLNA